MTEKGDPGYPEHETATESVVDGIDRMRDDGGVAPELPHRQGLTTNPKVESNDM